jgi:hypothetical protein
MSHILKYSGSPNHRSRHNAAGDSRNPRNFAISTNNATGAGMAIQRPSFGATGGQSANFNTAPLFGIQIVNASTSNVSNFDIFGAYQYLFAPGIGNGSTGSLATGNMVSGGVTISTLFTSTNYLQFLASTQSQQFRVGGVYMQVTTGNTQLAFDVFTVNTQSQSGSQTLTPVKPILSPNQFQGGVSTGYCSVVIDGYTKLTWSTLYASTTIQISFFPDTTINPSNALNGGSVSNSHGQAPISL